jgi:hypothetical protein
LYRHRSRKPEWPEWQCHRCRQPIARA